MKYTYEVLERRVAYQRHFTLLELRLRHQLFAGGWSKALDRELFDRGDAVGVLPYDPVRDEVVMVEQFRVGAMRDGESPWLMEFIAGLVEPGEPPQAVARREAREEANLNVGELEAIGSFFLSPGGSTEKLHLYCGRTDTRGAGGVFGLADEGEDIKVHVLPRQQVVARLEEGNGMPAWTVLAIQWLALNWQGLKTRWTGAA